MFPHGLFETIFGFIGGATGLSLGCALHPAIAAQFELSEEEIETSYSAARSRSRTLLRPIIERDTDDCRTLLRPHDE
jgi:hypothetical protein